MLSSTAVPSSQLSMGNPRQISINSAASAVLYTVPIGRKFVGYIYGNSTAPAYSLTPAGGVANTQFGSALSVAYQSTTPFEIVLVAGSIVTGLGTTLHINGIESDL